LSLYQTILGQTRLTFPLFHRYIYWNNKINYTFRRKKNENRNHACVYAYGYHSVGSRVYRACPDSLGGPAGTVSPPVNHPAGTNPAHRPGYNTGSVQMWVTDARAPTMWRNLAIVSDVKIHQATGVPVSDNGSGEAEGVADNSTDTAGWISVNLTGPGRFDLLTLKSDGLQQVLATANLTVGQYTQIRMTVSKVEVKINGVLQVAVLPSGTLKFVHPFDVQAGSVTKLLFDFDADKFVTVTGSPKEPKIMVKPVVKMVVSRPAPPAGGSAVKISTPTLPNSAGASYNVTLLLPAHCPIRGASSQVI
jgi:hypothetical protein